jgi:hypothetical protein
MKKQKLSFNTKFLMKSIGHMEKMYTGFKILHNEKAYAF